MTSDRDRLPPGFDDALVRALWIWAERHPFPHEPVISTADGHIYTPLELAREVAERTPFGRKQPQVLQHFAASEPSGVDELVEMFVSVAMRRR